jgi:hypothetical protein
MISSETAQKQLSEIRSVDQTKFQRGDTWYVVEMTWMVKWLQFVFNSTTSSEEQVEQQEEQKNKGDGIKEEPTQFSIQPGPLTNHLLFDEERSPPTLLTTIKLKKDYRIVCSEVWELFVKYYSMEINSPIITITNKEHIDKPEEWDIKFSLPECSDQLPPKSLNIELVPHVHTTKCNRRVSVCDTPGKFREREIIRISGKTGKEKDRIVWWRRRRRLGEDHGTDDSRDEPNLNLWERIPGAVGTTQYIIRMEEHDHLIRAQYIFGKEQKKGNMLLSNAVGPCEESVSFV